MSTKEALDTVLCKDTSLKERYGSLLNLLHEANQRYSALSSDHIAYLRIDLNEYPSRNICGRGLDESEISLIKAIDNLAEHYHRQIGVMLYMDRHDTEAPVLNRLLTDIYDKFFDIALPAEIAAADLTEREVFLALNGIPNLKLKI
jgi:hypothetical protein